MPKRPWWQTAVVYQIYPRSFADGNDDGVGDLAGLRARLEHLVWLGVDAIWLSPIFPSPMKDFGYDVADYCDVDPLFGSLAELDALVAEAHAAGLRVLLDWVPNHTSDQHAWFRESRTSRTNPKRDWYVWRDPKPDGSPPNNWRRAFAKDASAWTLDPATGQYYLHLFLPEQPDLNWGNRGLTAAMFDVARFWLDRGIDGFRIDVTHAIGKNPWLPDDPPEWAGVPHVALHDDPTTHAILRGLRRFVDEYPGDRMLVGEVFYMPGPKHAEYYGQGDELHLVFNLPAAVLVPWDAASWRDHIEQFVRMLEPVGGWPTWVLSNHDSPRHRTRFGSEARARAAAVMLLALPGTPFLYAGEEIGLENATIPRDRVVDPGGRDGSRTPIPWDGTPAHGWTHTPWLPWAPEPETRNVERLRDDPASILHVYRRMLAARRASPALHGGTFRWLAAPDGVLAWMRVADGERCTVVVNFTDAPQAVAASGMVVVESEGRGEGAAFGGIVPPNAAVVLR